MKTVGAGMVIGIAIGIAIGAAIAASQHNKSGRSEAESRDMD